MQDRPLIETFQPRRWQQLVWSALAEQNLLVLHRSAGKTMLCSAFAAFRLLTLPVAAQIGIFAPSLKKARKLLFSQTKALLESKATPHIKFLKSEGKIVNENTNSYIDFFSLGMDGNSDQARGERITIAIIDELDECDPEAFFSVVVPTQQGLPQPCRPFKTLVAIGTPRGSASLLTNLVSKYRPNSPDFSHINVNEHNNPLTDQQIQQQIQQTENLSSSYRFFHFPNSRTDLLTEEEVNMNRLLMDKSTFEREIEVSLTAQSTDTIFPIADLLRASQPPDNPTEHEPDTQGHIHAPRQRHIIEGTAIPTAGLDISGSGPDQTILAIRQGATPLYIGPVTIPKPDAVNHAASHAEPPRHVHALTRLNMDATIRKVLNLCNRYKAFSLSVDATGIGDFFAERLTDLAEPYGIYVYPVKANQSAPYHWKDSTFNVRACLAKIAALYVQEHAGLPNSPQLLEELSAFTKDAEHQDPRLKVVGKDKIKKALGGRSPDLADAWLLTFYEEATCQSPEDLILHLQTLLQRDVIPTAAILEQYPELYL